MSWVPATGGLREPTTRTAPKHTAATPIFTFGRSQQEAAEDTASTAATAVPKSAANYDPPVGELAWWRQPRSKATVSGCSSSDVDAFWAKARQDPAQVAQLVNSEARAANREVGKGSNMRLGDRQTFKLSDTMPAYKADFCSAHVPVGKRSVRQSAEAMQAALESKLQAQKNKQIGRSSNLKIQQFD